MAPIGYTGDISESRANYHSKLADQKNTNNITGFKNKRVDDIIERLREGVRSKKRVKMLQEFDGIFTNQHHYILEWARAVPAARLLEQVRPPAGDSHPHRRLPRVPSLWWIDPEKNQQARTGHEDPSINLGEGRADDKYWLEFAKRESQRQQAASK